MDSLTQIVLGAAVGETVLGKKIGNRAMLWGGIAGTIPDLDVLGNYFMNEAESLAFHRGISHSISFSIVGGLILAFLLAKAYRFKYFYILEFLLTLLFFSLIMGVIGSLGFVSESNSPTAIGLAGIAFLFWIYGIKTTWKDYAGTKDVIDRPSSSAWFSLFFLGLFTHAILDCFTSYGTQLFAPFSNYRVAWGNISVADPFYTLPLLFFLLLASLYHRQDNKRKLFIRIGLGISSLYMLFTIFNKRYIVNVMEQTIKSEIPDAIRYTVIPSILQNILWSGTIETDSVYYQGQYSLFDRQKKFKLQRISKGHHLISDAKDDDETIQIVKWFSDNYYSCIIRSDGRLQINDMRYGTFRENSYNEDDFIFRFIMEKDENGYYHMQNSQGGPPKGREASTFISLFERVKGI